MKTEDRVESVIISGPLCTVGQGWLYSFPLVTELVRGLILKTVNIGGHASLGSSSTLECLFDLQGERLYSVKWYKDGEEFFRYLPRDRQRVQGFPIYGVSVDVSSRQLVY